MAIISKGSGGSIKFTGTGGGIRMTSSGGGGGGSVSPIVPNTLSGLVAWFKADSLALNNNDPVTYWQDESTNANHLDQWEAGNNGYINGNLYTLAPKYTSADPLLNNMPSVTYGNYSEIWGGTSNYDANVSNYKSNPTGLPTGNSPHTTYVVGYWNGQARNGPYAAEWHRGLFGWGNNSGPGKRMSVTMLEGGIFADGWASATNTRPLSHNSSFIFSFPYDGTDFSSPTTYLNGVSLTGPLGTSTSPLDVASSSTELAIGRIPTVAAGQHRWTGAIAEVIVFNTVHDAATRKGIEKYLSDKYGIAVVDTAESMPPRASMVGWWNSETIGKYSNGDTVYVWPDMSGKANHLYDTGGVYTLPTFTTSDPNLNNKSALNFSGFWPGIYRSGNWATVSGFPYSNVEPPTSPYSPPLTIYTVAYMDDSDGATIWHWGTRPNTQYGQNYGRCFGFYKSQTSGTPFVGPDNFNRTWGGLEAEVGTAFVASWAHTENANVEDDPMYLNGATQASLVPASPGTLDIGFWPYNGSQPNIVFGTPWANGQDVPRFRGKIAEVLVYAEKHDLTTMTNITNHLKAKYGIV